MLSFKRLGSLLPFAYWLITRGDGWKGVTYLIATSWIPAWWIIHRAGGLGLVQAASAFALGYLAFLCVYECGYLVNDTWDARSSANGRHRLPFAIGPLYVASFLVIRIVIWAAIAFSTGWTTHLAWLAGFAWLAVAFAEHNLLKAPALRVGSFVQLATLRFLMPMIAIVPLFRMPAAAAICLAFYTFPRTLSYMDSKSLLNMPERRRSDFTFKLTLVLAPAVTAIAYVLHDSLIIEMLVYFVAVYGGWSVVGGTLATAKVSGSR